MEELKDDMYDKGFVSIGVSTFKNGVQCVEFVKETYGVIRKQLYFVGALFENSKHFICSYRGKERLTKSDIGLLNEIEKDFCEVISKYGYTKIGKSLWNEKKRSSPKMIRVNFDRFNEVIGQADSFQPIDYAGNEFHFYNGDKLIAIEINIGTSKKEYYIYDK